MLGLRLSVGVGLFLLMPALSTGALIDSGDGLTVDDRGTPDPSDDLHWIRDLSEFVGLTYTEQLAAIEELNTVQFGGFTDWHLATEAEVIGTLLNEDFGSTEQPNPTGLYSPAEVAAAFVPTGAGEGSLTWKGRYDLVLQDFPRGGHWEVIITQVDGREPEYQGGRVGVADDEVFPGALVVSGGAASSVPEPHAVVLLLAGGLVAFSRRPRQASTHARALA